MNKKELVEKVVNVLKENNIRKGINAHRTHLYISDDEGNSTTFVVKKSGSSLQYLNKDVQAILEALLAVVEDALKHGEEISLQGFGSIGVHRRAARRAVHPVTGEDVEVAARYVPKFNFGNNLRIAAKIYEASLKDRESPS